MPLIRRELYAPSQIVVSTIRNDPDGHNGNYTTEPTSKRLKRSIRTGVRLRPNSEGWKRYLIEISDEN
jgi:hypothetical protein